MLPLTKSCDPADLTVLSEEVARVEAAGALVGQHPMRAWEYSLALRAYASWQETHQIAAPMILDVGGAGSTFYQLTHALVIDPAVNLTIEEYVRQLPIQVHVVFAISVIEHIEIPRTFIRAIATVLRPGGLAFLTMDGCDYDGEDVSHFHWMRKRIYSIGMWQKLAKFAATRGLKIWGGTDWRYHGHQVYDYSFLSLCLVKRDDRG